MLKQDTTFHIRRKEISEGKKDKRQNGYKIGKKSFHINTMDYLPN
ncbi:hypothetical protein EVA_02697 [gut metagenome]|uniref:Uncharacterized protein n=1 Tax=gut metagenome TaxID=749906 RepID=J9GMI8_9ZZZZ